MTEITGMNYSIRPAVNGFIVEKSWVEVKEDKVRDWKTENAVFLQWDEVITYLQNNKI